MTCYYSPTGGTVQAILTKDDPAMELQVLLGAMKKLTLANTHAACKNIEDANAATLLNWKVNAAGEVVAG